MAPGHPLNPEGAKETHVSYLPAFGRASGFGLLELIARSGKARSRLDDQMIAVPPPATFATLHSNMSANRQVSHLLAHASWCESRLSRQFLHAW